MYGWRGRIGLIIPSSNTTMESEFWRMVPEGVSIHTTRLKLLRVTVNELKEMAKNALHAAQLLATANVDVIVYGCTSGALIGGIEWEENLRKNIEEHVKIPTITTAFAVAFAAILASKFPTSKVFRSNTKNAPGLISLSFSITSAPYLFANGVPTS